MDKDRLGDDFPTMHQFFCPIREMYDTSLQSMILVLYTCIGAKYSSRDIIATKTDLTIKFRLL